MKKIVCTMAMAALLCAGASAASGSYRVTAELSPDIRVKIDGVERVFYNVQGEEIHPISYADTTYLPLRSIGELMDKNVNWDASTNTATLGGNRVTPDATGTPDKNAREKQITFTAEPGYTIVIDGVKRTFHDASGKPCDPMVYNGSIYLPIRAIGEIMGKTVSWDNRTETIFLDGKTGASGGDVTDYDTANPSGSNKPSGDTATQPSGTISLARAKEIALDHAGRKSGEATFVKGELERDDGRWVYEIEFIVRAGAGYAEYDYEIHAVTGKILDYDYDAENYAPSSSAGTSISEARAKEIALSRVPGATASNLYEFELDYDDGRAEYEGKIVYKGMEYEFSIDASTGAVTEWDVESIYD